MVQQNRAISRVLQRMLHRPLSAALARWQSEAVIMVQEQRTMSLVLHHMVQHFKIWQSEAASMAQEQMVLSSAMLHLLYGQLCNVFEKWQSETVRMVQQKKVIGCAVHAMIHRQLRAAFVKWKSAEYYKMHTRAGLRQLEGIQARTTKLNMADAIVVWSNTWQMHERTGAARRTGRIGGKQGGHIGG